MDPNNARRIKELTDERRQLMERHERLTAQIIADVADSDRPPALESIEDSKIESLIDGVRAIKKNRDRLRELNGAITELARS